MFNVVGDAFHVTTLGKNFAYSIGKHLLAWAIGDFIVNKDLTNLQEVLMLPVVDTQDVQEA